MAYKRETLTAVQWHIGHGIGHGVTRDSSQTTRSSRCAGGGEMRDRRQTSQTRHRLPSANSAATTMD